MKRKKCGPPCGKKQKYRGGKKARMGLRLLPDEPIGRRAPKLAPQNAIFVIFLAYCISGKLGLSCRHQDENIKTKLGDFNCRIFCAYSKFQQQKNERQCTYIPLTFLLYGHGKLLGNLFN